MNGDGGGVVVGSECMGMGQGKYHDMEVQAALMPVKTVTSLMLLVLIFITNDLHRPL